jgi:hypothetical protein
MHVNAGINKGSQGIGDALDDTEFIGEDPDDPMKRKSVDPLAPGPGEPISSGRVYWGMIADGQKFPHALAGDRRVIDLARDMMPAELRSQCRVIRVRLTMWRFDHDPEQQAPKKRARKAP